MVWPFLADLAYEPNAIYATAFCHYHILYSTPGYILNAIYFKGYMYMHINPPV